MLTQTSRPNAGFFAARSALVAAAFPSPKTAHAPPAMATFKTAASVPTPNPTLAPAIVHKLYVVPSGRVLQPRQQSRASLRRPSHARNLRTHWDGSGQIAAWAGSRRAATTVSHCPASFFVCVNTAAPRVVGQQQRERRNAYGHCYRRLLDIIPSASAGFDLIAHHGSPCAGRCTWHARWRFVTLR
jgi:hypothetical protein